MDLLNKKEYLSYPTGKFVRLGLLLFLAMTMRTWAQSPSPNVQISAAGSNQPAVQFQALNTSYLQARDALFSQEQALIAGGATAAQIAAWHQQNAAQFAALKQQSEALAALLNQQPMAAPPPVTIPANATPEMQEFLQNRATLAASLAQLHNQAAGSGFVPATGTPGTATGAPAVVTVGQQWEQQNAALLQRQQQLAGILAQQAAQQPVTLPPPLIIPANASPQLQAYLTLRDQLARDQMNLQSQYATADPATRQAALSQWQKNNASRFQQLQQLAQALTPTTQTTSGSSP